MRLGDSPEHRDEDVAFRNTYCFRVFDYCQIEKIIEGKIQEVKIPVSDALYRFKMSGKAERTEQIDRREQYFSEWGKLSVAVPPADDAIKQRKMDVDKLDKSIENLSSDIETDQNKLIEHQPRVISLEKTENEHKTLLQRKQGFHPAMMAEIARTLDIYQLQIETLQTTATQ